jgi:hypothetical protein
LNAHWIGVHRKRARDYLVPGSQRSNPLKYFRWSATEIRDVVVELTNKKAPHFAGLFDER